MRKFVVPPVGFRDARIPAFIWKESSLRRFLANHGGSGVALGDR